MTIWGESAAVARKAGDRRAELVKGADKLTWAYYGSVGAEWLTEPLGLK